jgi:hypothetical protein
MSMDSRSAPRQSLTERTFIIFLRIMAAACLYMGLRYWDLVIGLTSHGAIRFDVMRLPWRTVSTAFAVLYPIISLGLWMGASWGVVLWVAAATGEILIHTVWKGVFGPDYMVIAMHLSAACLYVAFRVALYVEKRRRRGQVTLHSP